MIPLVAPFDSNSMILAQPESIEAAGIFYRFQLWIILFPFPFHSQVNPIPLMSEANQH